VFASVFIALGFSYSTQGRDR
jgi:hypothetical protein